MHNIAYWILSFFVIIIIYPGNLYGKIEFHEVLPNTIDDTNLEYIELRNNGCEAVDISQYMLEDASAKKYTIGNTTILLSHENIRISRTISKIILNNTDEILYLKDPIGFIVSEFSYANSIKGEKITNPNSVDITCSIIDTNSGSNQIPSTNTGITQTGLDNNTGSGIIDNGNTGSGGTNSGSVDIIGTGSILTGSIVSSSGEIIYNSGSNSGSETAFSGIIFPEIIPSIQSPTNAIFSGGVFDCTNQVPCRINITLDSIFNSSFLAKNYICEFVTETGAIMDCNPNTFYYNTGSTIVFRLTSKTDATQSISKTWNVIFKEGEMIQSSGSTQLGNIDTSSGEIIVSSGVLFPGIIPVFQNYTNTTFSGNILACVTSPCRVNMNFESIFTGSFQSKDYTCEITYSGSIYDCNPPQLYLEGTGSIHISIIHKGTKQQISSPIGVSQKPIPMTENKNSGDSIVPIKDTNPPIVILEYDGKLKQYHEQIGEYEMNCYTNTCSINLTAEKSYDPEGGKVEFLWFYGLNDIKTSKDPGERKYEIGDHQIWLRVIDASGNVAQIRYHIHVLGEKSDNRIIEKSKKLKAVKDVFIKEKVKKPKKKIKKVTFFEPPEVILQKSKFIASSNGYICKTTTKNCSINLTINNPQKGLIYTWIYTDGTQLDSKNPKAKSFTAGKHIVKLIAGYSSGTPIWTKDILIEVIKTQKPKKIKKQKPKKIVQISGSNKEKIQPTYVEKSKSGTSNNSDNFPIAVLALIGGIMPIYFVKKTLLKTNQRSIDKNSQ